jgi:hypothetical protein
MTEFEGRGDRRRDAEPPLSVDLLADLHAGVLDDETSARLWPRAKADPQAQAILEALDSTRVDLAGFGRAPAGAPMPPNVVARLDAALAEETRPSANAGAPTPPRGLAPVADISAARRRRNRRIGWGVGLVAAAAAVVGIGVVAVPQLQKQSGTPMAEPTAPSVPSSSPPLALSSGELKSRAPSALGARDFGPLGDQRQLRGCLAANKVPARSTVAGAKQLTLDGKPGVLLLLTTGKSAQFRLLVVSADCANGHPATLSNSMIGTSVVPTR